MSFTGWNCDGVPHPNYALVVRDYHESVAAENVIDLFRTRMVVSLGGGAWFDCRLSKALARND